MNENKFTPTAEEALRLAQEAAGELGHGYVGTEHLLLGLMREDEGLAHTVLTEAGLTDELLTEIIRKSVGAGLPGGNPAQGLTPRAKRVIEVAMEDSIRGGFNYVGTEHLLAGILREGNNMAVRILRTAGSETTSEGCLSFPGEYGLVERPTEVEIEAEDRHGKTFRMTGHDLLARAFCHETDHLDGKVFKTIAIEMLDEEDL